MEGNLRSRLKTVTSAQNNTKIAWTVWESPGKISSLNELFELFYYNEIIRINYMPN